MNISCIIPAYNHLDDVLRCAYSLGGHMAGDCELIVQDDCSPDVDFTGLIPFANVERNAVNRGFAGNCNAGATRAKGDIFFFVNQDVVAVPEWSQGWDNALRVAFADPQVGIVGARLLFPDGSIQSAGGLIDGGYAPIHRCLAYSNPRYCEVNEPQQVSWVTGAALAIRRELFTQVGGFDTGYVGGYFEDVDICLKVRELGYKVWYEPRCTLIHKVGSTGGNPNFGRNALRFKAIWVDSGKVKPDTAAIGARYW